LTAENAELEQLKSAQKSLVAEKEQLEGKISLFVSG
jgi:hypothetical protein